MRGRLIFLALVTAIVICTNLDTNSTKPVHADDWSNPQDPRAQALMEVKTCQVCHSVGDILIGPSYRTVAERYRANPDKAAVLDILRKSVRQGSVDKYGPVPMSALDEDVITNKDLDYILNWLLKLK